MCALVEAVSLSFLFTLLRNIALIRPSIIFSSRRVGFFRARGLPLPPSRPLCTSHPFSFCCYPDRSQLLTMHFHLDSPPYSVMTISATTRHTIWCYVSSRTTRIRRGVDGTMASCAGCEYEKRILRCFFLLCQFSLSLEPGQLL